MGLRDTYAWAISQAKGKFDGNAEERDGKLYWTGTVKTEDEKNEIWAAIKTIPSWREDVVADIKGLTEGRGADVTIEALGRQDTFEAALRSLRPGGTLSSLGDHASSPRSDR